MSAVRLVLLTAPGGLSPELQSEALMRTELDGAESTWLAEGEAWQANVPTLAGLDRNGRREKTQAIRQKISDLPLDACLVSQSAAQTKLLAADMDSTMIGQECIDELAGAAGSGAAVKQVTERAMRGELDFTQSLHQRVSTLAGLPEEVIDQLLAETIKITPGAAQAIQTLEAAGIASLLVSGGFTRFAGPIAEKIGFRWYRANALDIERGLLTGKVNGDIVDGAAKVTEISARARELGADLSETVAIGDGANDLPMLAAAGLGIAFRAKPKVQHSADAAINFANLRAILFLLGLDENSFHKPLG